MCARLTLHKKDLPLLERIQSFFGVGHIYKEREDTMCYQVLSLQDIINVIIPHFEKYPLLTQKRADFLLFKAVVELVAKKRTSS